MKQLDMKQVLNEWNELLAKGQKIIAIYAELAEDSFCTGDVIMVDDIINKDNDSYLASTWATPQVIFELEDETITLPAWEEGDNPSVVKEWIEAGCLGLVKEYEIDHIHSWMC